MHTCRFSCEVWRMGSAALSAAMDQRGPDPAAFRDFSKGVAIMDEKPPSALLGKPPADVQAALDAGGRKVDGYRESVGKAVSSGNFKMNSQEKKQRDTVHK